MKSIVQQVIQSEDFQRELRDTIVSRIVGESGRAYDAKEGAIEASVAKVRIGNQFTFEPAEGNGLEWSVEFSSDCHTTLRYFTPDGEDMRSDLSGTCEGKVDLTFPATTLDYEDPKDLTSGIDLDVLLRSFPKNERRDGPDDGSHSASVTSPLKPRLPASSSAAAKALPKSKERKAA